VKVLLNRSSSFIGCRLIVLAIQYNWSAKTETSILIKLFKYLRVSSDLWYSIRYSQSFVHQALAKLSPEKLRKLMRLCEIICKFPDMFDRLFQCFTSIPLVRLDRILELDKQWGCP